MDPASREPCRTLVLELESETPSHRGLWSGLGKLDDLQVLEAISDLAELERRVLTLVKTH